MCTVSITGILGHESAPGQGIDSLTITGTATQCSAVTVAVHQTVPVDVFLPARQANVDGQGNWSVDYSIALGDFSPGDFVCGRGNKFVIRAECVDDPQCRDSVSGARIPCGACPALSAHFSGVRPSDPCDGNGQRHVGITMDVTLGSSGTATITLQLQAASAAPGAVDVGPTTTVTSNTTIPATGPWQVTLSPGDYTVTAVFADQQCPPQQFDFTVPACPAVVCPQVTWSADTSQPCDANGRRPVTVTATIVFPGATIDADLLNAQGQSIAHGVQADDLTLVAVVSLAGGDFDFSVRLNSPSVPDSCRPDLHNTFSVPQCGGTTCPTVAWTSNVSGTCNADNTRNVSVTATVTSFGAPVEAELHGPQDQVLDTRTTPANGSATLNSGPLTLAGGNHQFSVVFTSGLPAGCAANDRNTINVPQCGGGNGGGRESVGCAVLRLIGLTLLIAGLVAVVGGACSVNTAIIIAGAAAAAIGFALLVWWALACGPEVGCRAFERLIGAVNALITAFAVITAIFAALAALGIVVGWPCALGAVSDTTFLAILEQVLMQLFLSQGCHWQSRSIYD